MTTKKNVLENFIKSSDNELVRLGMIMAFADPDLKELDKIFSNYNTGIINEQLIENLDKIINLNLWKE
jgi:hypothetical protein